MQTWLPQMDILGGIAARSAGVPWVMGERSSADAFKGTWKQHLRVLAGRHADALIANSAGGARFWRHRLPKLPVHVIPNALPLADVDAAGVASDVGVPLGARLVLAAGRCVPEKNQQILIDALALLPPDVHLAICGEGPLLEETRARAAAKGVADRVHFPGYVAEIWSWMKRADVFVSVGLYEGHPNAVLEAMAARRPVVVSDIEAHRDVLTEREARFAPPADAPALARAIAEALHDRSTDRIEAARTRAEQFSIEACAAAYEAVYRQAGG